MDDHSLLEHVLNLDECKFILMTRSFKSAWVSSILRRHIRSYGSCKTIRTID